MNRLFALKINNPVYKLFAVIFLILIVWLINILFLPQVAKWGMNGHDWEYLLYFDSFKGNELENFQRIRADLGNPYFLQIVYYLGILKQVFGLNQTAFKLVDILWRSLAAISVGYLIYKLTKNKLFSYLSVFFYTIFPSTAGPFNFVMSGVNSLIIPFTCLFIVSYIESIKKPKKILLAALFFYLALISGPARAYLLVFVPLFVELIRLIRSFRPFVFIGRSLIFYLMPFITLQSSSSIATLNMVHEITRHIKLVTDGNSYSLTMPFQMFSTLFIDQTILKDFLGWDKLLLPSLNSDLGRFLIFDLVLLIISIFLGFAIKGKKNIYAFVLKVMIPTLIFEAIFYFLGLLSSHFTGIIPFLDPEGRPYLNEPLNPTVFQASLGGYIFMLGLILAIEWRKNQRDNKILMVIAGAWFWFVALELEMFLTSYRWEMIYESNDRYIMVAALGAVIFAAGIFSLSVKALGKLKSLKLKLLLISLLTIFTFLITWKDYEFLYRIYYNWNENMGGSAYWQDTMYQRFLNKFGKDNLKKDIFLYIDPAVGDFNRGSFYNLLGFRIFYDVNGNIIRDNCKVVTDNIDVVKKAYTINNGEKGFTYDTKCVDIGPSTIGKKVFYPLSNFYAYRMKNKDFVDIKDEIIAKLDQEVP